MSEKADAQDHASFNTSSSGPLRLLHEHDRVFVVGFGLRIEARDETEAREIIEELEEAGYRICW
jgi:hypothetical protein